MDYDKLKEEIKVISEISSSVPENFRSKCFEILLNNLLISNKPEDKKLDTSGTPRTPPSDPPADIPLSSQMRVLMKKHQITKEHLEELVMYEGQEVHFISEPSEVAIAKGQKYWALLLALKNGIEKNEFTTDPEALRSICQEKGFYDNVNFATNLKKKHFSDLFNKQLESQGGAQQLSDKGKTELAKLIKELAGQSNEG